MKNIMTRILNFLLNFKLLKYLLKRPSWSSNVRIVEWYKIFIASIWVLYLALEIDQFKRFALPIYKFVSNYNFLKDIISILYVNRVIILLVLTIPTILFWFLDIIFKKVNYKKLDPELFPEYDLDDHPYQTRLVEFLNSPDSIHNVFWLDGSWGSGKTFFIKTFFENQIYKKKEIYYISCFGIKTRDQAEKILINEIEKQSILGNLDFIPLVGGVFKWFFKIVGTDLMKRDSIVIFDDLERVSYVAKTDKPSDTAKSDNPSDYNDLLGYIDHLSENKKIKIIVILNSKEMESTKENLIDKKFKLNHNRMVSTGEVIDNILKKSKLRDDDFGKMLSLIFKIYYVDKNYREVQEKNQQMKEEKLSLREFQKSLEKLSNKTDESEKANYIIKWMNGWGGTENILVSLFEYLDKDEIDKYFEHLYERNSYLYFEMLSIILNYDIPGMMSDYPLVSINQKTMYSMFDVKQKYFFELLSFLWKKGLKNLFISKTGDEITVDNHGIPDIEEKKYLVEIYYGLQNGYINIKNQKDKLNELLKNEKYRDFVQNYLSFKI
ncbi:P-loop NTPase fold protein [Streptococcus mitis]|uniref:P-loop NTPase fold protein n=1 Tax=Streptococcus mitis TaxID=28037 RepID=UPI0019316FF3|nr:P-loop NTPase fold protein [Streptococcus mitis]